MAHSGENAETEARRVLNLKALGVLAGGAILLAIGVSRIHAMQVVRTSNYLKETADKALAENDFRRAFDLYEQYMSLNPSDESVEEQVAVLLQDHGKSAKALKRAFKINERLLLNDKTRDDLRLRQVEISDLLGRYSDAAVHLKTMREQRSDLSDVWHFSGIVAKDTGNFADAMTYFANAISLEDPVAESYQYLAELKASETDDLDGAEQILNEMIAREDSAKTRRIRADWLMQQQRPEDAIPDLWSALNRDRDDEKITAMLLKSIRLARAKDSQFDATSHNLRLVSHLNDVLAANPDEPRLRLYMSSAQWATGQRAAAIDNLRVGISRDPRQFEMYEVLVDYLVSDRQHEAAQQVFDDIPERVIARGRREFMRGRLLMSQKKWEEAINAFDMSIGFAHDDESISSRARVCLALCRRESGDNVAALEAYTALIQANPDFEGGRLGIASAYLRADQIPMAIAEYRQLLHVEGVPPFLANLMIKHNLSLPKQQRDWSRVSDLLRDENPIVVDKIQRNLLQADLIFAKGFPAQAMDHLDKLARRNPGQPEVERARQRLTNIHGDRLMSRVLEVLEEDNRNIEGHISVLRLHMARNDTAGMTTWLNNMMNGTAYPKLSNIERIRLLAESATAVADAELVTRGHSQQLRVLQEYAAASWRQLSPNGPEFLRQYVRFVGVHQSAKNAIKVTEWVQQNADTPTQAICWVECLKASVHESQVQVRVTNELIALIRKEPSDMGLRLTYAESRILLQKYAEAGQLLQQIVKYDQDNGRAFARLAWLATLVDQNSEVAMSLSERASALFPTDPGVRAVRALALAESGKADQAMQVLSSIPDRDRTVASWLYEARTLLLADRRSAAKDLVLELSQEKTVAQLDPAEVNLLTRLQQELQVEPRHMTSRY